LNRRIRIIVLSAVVFCATTLISPNLRANTVVWNAQATALTLSDLITLNPATNLIMMGYFTTNDSAVINLAINPLMLSSLFVPISTSTVGKFGETQYSFGGIWGASVSANFQTLGIAYSNIYVWAFDAQTIAGASEQGIFKFAATFPDEMASPVTIDLTNLFTGGTVLWGSTDQGPGNVNTALGSRPHINLAAIPEPSGFMLVAAGLAGLLVLRRRKK